MQPRLHLTSVVGQVRSDNIWRRSSQNSSSALFPPLPYYIDCLNAMPPSSLSSLMGWTVYGNSDRGQIYARFPVTQAYVAPSNSCQHIINPNSRSIRFLHQLTTTHVLTSPFQLYLAAFTVQRTAPRLSDLHASTLAVVATSGSLPDAQHCYVFAKTYLPA